MQIKVILNLFQDLRMTDPETADFYSAEQNNPANCFARGAFMLVSDEIEPTERSSLGETLGA